MVAPRAGYQPELLAIRSATRCFGSFRNEVDVCAREVAAGGGRPSRMSSVSCRCDLRAPARSLERREVPRASREFASRPTAQPERRAERVQLLLELAAHRQREKRFATGSASAEQAEARGSGVASQRARARVLGKNPWRQKL